MSIAAEKRKDTLRAWLRLRPLIHCLKSARYKIVDEIYRRRAPRSAGLTVIRDSLRNKKAIVTIAFSDPQSLDWQVSLIRFYVPDAVHLVVDNSTEDVDAEALRAVAERHRVLYVRLPENPWIGRPSRSHGIAMNWVWHNVIRPGAPEAFGFVDDDLFPTAMDDPFAPLARQDIYGAVRDVGSRWFLWAGFCFFSYGAVSDKQLDFGQDWFIGLDTGGGNWSKLYCKIDRARLTVPHVEFVPFRAGLEVADGPLQWCGSWLHEIGLMGKPELVGDKRQVVANILAPHLAAASLSAR